MVIAVIACLAVVLPGLVWHMVVTERAEVVRLRHENALLMRRIASDASLRLGNAPQAAPDFVPEPALAPQMSFFTMKKPSPPAGYPAVPKE